MINLVKWADSLVNKILTGFCATLLLLMVIFAVYNVIMRYVFENPPVWGDLLTVLSNIWLVFIALALTVRDRDHIALDLIYTWLPEKLAFVVQQFWTLVIFCLGISYDCLRYGSGMLRWAENTGKCGTSPGNNGELVFKPNYMPKKYAIAIVPISGVLICVGAVASIS